MLAIIQFLNLTILILWPPVLCEVQSMQGLWRVTADGNGTFGVSFPQGMRVRIQGNKIISLDSDERAQELFPATDEPGLNRFGINPFTRPKKVGVMWCEGIYEVSRDRIRFSIKYHGQGVEGEAARNWKAPVDFEIKEGQSVWTFTREKK